MDIDERVIVHTFSLSLSYSALLSYNRPTTRSFHTPQGQSISGFVNKEQEKSILLLSGFIAAVVLDKAHNLVRKGFPAGFAEMDMNVKGRAADVLHKVGFGGQRGSGCGGAGLAGFIVHRLSFQR